MGASSDPTAAKPMNKAEQFAAEPVEPRTETKGNVSQQSTRRAQDRGSVSQALERVRQAARKRNGVVGQFWWHVLGPACPPRTVPSSYRHPR